MNNQLWQCRNTCGEGGGVPSFAFSSLLTFAGWKKDVIGGWGWMKGVMPLMFHKEIRTVFGVSGGRVAGRLEGCTRGDAVGVSIGAVLHRFAGGGLIARLMENCIDQYLLSSSPFFGWLGVPLQASCQVRSRMHVGGAGRVNQQASLTLIGQ